ncbi:HMCN1, partial [Symbiodinium necroappetens]
MLFAQIRALLSELELEPPRLMRAVRAEREANRHLGAAVDVAGEIESLELTAEDADCVWNDWVDWSVCQFTCGGGESIRTRKVRIMAQGHGKACDGNARESRECTKNDCPVDCLWADWSKYSACSSTCGPGTRSRSRDFRQAAEFGGAQCVGNTTQTSDCNLGDCPIDCEYADWDQWGGCSRSCGKGTRKRFRSIAVQPSADGTPCEEIGSDMEETSCGQNSCPVDCVLTDWGLWELCDVSCGMGVTRRTRSVQAGADLGLGYAGLACESLSENKTCDSGVCPVDCELSDW